MREKRRQKWETKEEGEDAPYVPLLLTLFFPSIVRIPASLDVYYSITRLTRLTRPFISPPHRTTLTLIRHLPGTNRLRTAPTR